MGNFYPFKNDQRRTREAPVEHGPHERARRELHAPALLEAHAEDLVLLRGRHPREAELLNLLALLIEREAARITDMEDLCLI